MNKERVSTFIASLPRRLLVLLIRGYQQVISPLSPPSCRFAPSCSAYAVTALQRYGVMKGGWLAFKRILRCNPWNPGGYDPVP
ncbi:MAG: membrane protein insertion efficiency factor YidD [Coriobacteriia bacterium]|nr:membrane protein insertion efficiency factor YidD [Coriobacteriia bacterium]